MEADVAILWRKVVSDSTIRILVVAVLGVALYNIIFLGSLHGAAVLLSYSIGIYSCRFLFQWLLLIFEALEETSPVFINELPKRTEEKPPNVVVSGLVDHALEQLLCRILNQFITTWYNNISSEPWFHYEIRKTIRDVITVLYSRASQVQIDQFILKKIIPICLNHIMTSKAQFNHEKQDYNDENRAQFLHVAVHSRKSEILCIQNLCACLLKHLLPKSILTCKSYAILLREIMSKSLLLSLSDAICNPSVLNHLILRYLDEENWVNESNCFESTLTIDRVNLLENFVNSDECYICNTSLRPDVNLILKDNNLQNAFMNYLRCRNAQHILQFCLDVGSFNEKILKPELEARELDDLFRDAWDLFSVYFSRHSPNCIDFQKDLASPLRKALSKDILKLRTTSTLFEAYEYAFSVLEDCCTDFYNSSEFYYWLYGRSDRNDTAPLDDSSDLNKYNSTKEGFRRKPIFEISDKLSKIKDALKPDPILEGRLHDLSSHEMESEEAYEIELGVDANLAITIEERNINKWQIAIPSVGSRLDPITNKPYTFFVIKVVSGEDGSEWTVERRPLDLFSLDSKLTEFHGNIADAQLPPKRLIVARTESIQMYEEYLNKLVKNSDLKSSQLLHKFLTSKLDFEEEEEESSFGKILRKSVVPNLRKERGQNLESFVSSLIASCKDTKYEWQEMNEEKCPKKRDLDGNTKDLVSFCNNLYGNNFNVNAEVTKKVILNKKIIKSPQNDHCNAFSFFLYTVFHIYHVRAGFVKLFLTLQRVTGGLFDRLITTIINKYLRRTVKYYNVTRLINTIQWAIFDNEIKTNDNESYKRKVSQLLNDMKHNNWFHPLYVVIFENLQDPKKNKQLYYRLLDAITEELFPEMKVPAICDD